MLSKPQSWKERQAASLWFPLCWNANSGRSKTEKTRRVCGCVCACLHCRS